MSPGVEVTPLLRFFSCPVPTLRASEVHHAPGGRQASKEAELVQRKEAGNLSQDPPVGHSALSPCLWPRRGVRAGGLLQEGVTQQQDQATEAKISNRARQGHFVGAALPPPNSPGGAELLQGKVGVDGGSRGPFSLPQLPPGWQGNQPAPRGGRGVRDPGGHSTLVSFQPRGHR